VGLVGGGCGAAHTLRDRAMRGRGAGLLDIDASTVGLAERLVEGLGDHDHLTRLSRRSTSGPCMIQGSFGCQRSQ